MANVIFKFGTKAQYDALALRDPNTLYWLTDVQELRKGDFLYGKGIAATTAAAGLLSAEDKATLDSLAGLHAVDSAISIGSDANGKTIGLQVSSVAGNVLEIKNDGLFVPTPAEVLVPEYTVEKQLVAEEGYSSSYKLKKTVSGSSEYVGDVINIPKDLVVESGDVKTVVTPDVPYEGAVPGDKYIDLVIANAAQNHIYIPVNDLVDTYTAGDGIVISNNQISVTNRTKREVTGTSGKALMFNESDGGGAKFEHIDGTMSFVGVNDGGKDGLTGQLYSVKKDASTGKNVGTRLNMTTNGFYYCPNSNGIAYTAADEIATKGDIAAAAMQWEEM